MSLSLSKSEAEDKASLLTEYELESTRSVTPKFGADNREVPKRPANGHDFLPVPLSGPVRPLSPDTMSNLSVDEYEQMRPSWVPPPNPNASQRRSSLNSPAPPPRKIRGKLEAFWVRNKGLAFMLIAQIFGTLMNVTTRLLEVEGNNGKGMHPLQILFARMGVTLIMASGYMWYKKTPHFPLGIPQIRWLLVARGFGGFFGVFGMYYSLLYLPLADATVITFLAPGLSCWACSILLKEPFGRLDQIACVVSLIGVVLIARPTTFFEAFGSPASDSPSAGGHGDAMPSANSTASAGSPDASSYDSVTPAQRLSGVAISLVGVLGAATAYTTLRWIGKRAHPLISVNYFAAWCTLVSMVMQIALPGIGFLLPANSKEWGYLFFLGTCGFVMQFLLSAGLSYERSSRATNITYTQMLFALAFDKLIFGHTPDIVSIAGSALILGSALCVATMGDTGKNSQPKEETENSAMCGTDATVGDEETGHGLISGMAEARDLSRPEGDDSADTLPAQEVPLRTLR